MIDQETLGASIAYTKAHGGGGGGGDVTGVKGNAESNYRKGNVNITPENLGLGNVNNTSDANKPVSTAQQTALDGKVDKVTGKGLSTNDYDNTAKGIVDGVTTALAGKANSSDLGDKTQLTTTDKSSAVVAINEVNGKIGDFIDISSDVTVDSHITLLNNNLTLQKIGKMVFLNLMFTTTAEIPTHTKIIDNIPYSPIVNSQSFQVFKQSSKDAFILNISRNSGTNTCYIITLDTIPTNTSVRSVLPIAVGN